MDGAYDPRMDMPRSLARRRLLTAFALASLPMAGQAGLVDWYNGVKVGSTLPDHDAEYVNRPPTGARLTLVDFWATWCAPCRAEIPRLNALYANLKPKGFEIVGLTEESPEVASAFLKRVPMEYPAGAGGKAPLQKALGVKALPYALLVDRSRKVLWRGQPSELDAAAIEGWLARAGEFGKGR